MTATPQEVLALKWGTIKGWDDISDETLALVQAWSDLGSSVSAMAQRDTPEQKALICQIIDSVAGSGGRIYSDWSGETFTAESAKEYVMNYGKAAGLGAS